MGPRCGKIAVENDLGISFQTVFCWLVVLVFLASKDDRLDLCVLLVLIIFLRVTWLFCFSVYCSLVVMFFLGTYYC